MIPSEEAVELAERVGKDPRLVHLILSESTEVVASRLGVLIVAHRLGYVMANAGIDFSNVAAGEDDECVLLLPKDPDASAALISDRLSKDYSAQIGVIINDSVGRAWRNGAVGIALGAAGTTVLDDLAGQPDLFGRILQTSQCARADEIAAAASIVMGQGAEGRPVVVVRGLAPAPSTQNATAMQRPKEKDLFR